LLLSGNVFDVILSIRPQSFGIKFEAIYSVLLILEDDFSRVLS
jgi:hypothetical protein